MRFFVDSQAAILAVANSKITSSLVLETVKQLNLAAADRHVEFNWTKAHRGTPGNELADKAAKEGGEAGNLGMILIPKAELKEKLKTHFYKQWETRWQKYNGARMAKLFYQKPGSNQAKYVLKLN